MPPLSQPFTIPYSAEAVADLHQRLDNTRFPLGVANEHWKYGMQQEWFRSFLHYWRHEFNWEQQVAKMNALPNFRVEIDGIPLHFAHLKGNGPAPLPIITTHGWPWSYWDYRDVAQQLSHPASFGGSPLDSFDVVVPSLPGFGYSSPLPVGHLSTRDVAHLWNKLMTEVLGYPTYCAHGGDWGAIVTAELAHAHASSLHGAHITLPMFFGLNRADITPDDYDEEEKHYPELMKNRMATATSHYTVQGIEPETLAYAMHDSPAGMAAWLIERRRLWSDSADANGHRDVESAFTMEELATLVSIYWFTETFGSSCRMYYGRTNEPWQPEHNRTPTMEAPTAMAVFPGDLIFLPRRAAQRVANIQRWTRMPAGGHFAAAEEPELVANDIVEFFRTYR